MMWVKEIKKWPPLLAAILSILIAVPILRTPPVIEGEDMEEFAENLRKSGLYVPETVGDEFTGLFKVSPYFRENTEGANPAVFWYVSLAKGLCAIVTGNKEWFDLRFLSALLVLQLAFCMYRLTEYLTKRKNSVEACIIAVFCVTVFASHGYTIFFHSLHPKGIGYVSLLTAVSLGFRYQKKRIHSLLLDFGILFFVFMFVLSLKPYHKVSMWIAMFQTIGYFVLHPVRFLQTYTDALSLGQRMIPNSVSVLFLWLLAATAVFWRSRKEFFYILFLSMICFLFGGMAVMGRELFYTYVLFDLITAAAFFPYLSKAVALLIKKGGSYRKKNKTLLLLMLPCFFLWEDSVTAAAQKQQTVLIVTDSQKEAAFFEMLAREHDVVPVTVYESEYEVGTAAQYDYLITASMGPLTEVENPKKRVIVLGEACRFMGLSDLKNYKNVSLEVFYQEWRQQGIFLKTISCFERYEGEGFGTLLIGERVKVPAFVKTGSFFLLPYYDTEGVLKRLAEEAAAGCFLNKSSGVQENEQLWEEYREMETQEVTSEQEKTIAALFFEKGNHLLIVVVFVGILLLLMLLLLGRKWNRKKFIR